VALSRSGRLTVNGRVSPETYAVGAIGGSMAITGVVLMLVGGPVHLVGTIKRNSAESASLRPPVLLGLAAGPSHVTVHIRF